MATDLLSNLYKQLGGVGLNPTGSGAPAPYANPLSRPATQTNPYNNYQAQIDAINAQTAKYAQEAKGYAAQYNALVNAQPKMLPYDYNSAQATARSQAEQAVNPLYAKMFNQYMSQARTNQTRQVEDTNRANTLLQESLANTQQGNALTGQRTAEDVTTNTGLINQQTDYYQQDTGQQFEQARQQAAGFGNAGDALKREASIAKTANVQEQRQTQSFNVQKQAQQLFKTRTFEDIARSNQLAGKATTRGTEENARQLTRFMEDYGTDLNAQGKYGTQIEVERFNQENKRLADLLGKTGEIARNNFNQYVATLKGARVQDINATRSAYGF